MDVTFCSLRYNYLRNLGSNFDVIFRISRHMTIRAKLTSNRSHTRGIMIWSVQLISDLPAVIGNGVQKYPRPLKSVYLCNTSIKKCRSSCLKDNHLPTRGCKTIVGKMCVNALRIFRTGVCLDRRQIDWRINFFNSPNILKTVML